ncbi:unnamed protein product [Urochloa decumbens]|uniref:F-box domain-containing protein n=1 Tax=Urochloa decumbens TaxID=240449 RepID=A0ABC9FQQ3_9POAL
MKKKLQGPDLISRLPDELLGSVITLLPTKDGARTQILSRRWRPLWRAGPLNIEASVDGFHRDELLASVFVELLSTHDEAPPVRRFYLNVNCMWSPVPRTMRIVDPLLQSPGLHGLQEFELLASHHVPASALRFSPALTVLSIRSVRWERADEVSTDIVCMLNFPSLKHLALSSIFGLSERAIHSLLSRCPILESLSLCENTGCRRIQISSLTLRSLAVSDGDKRLEGKLEELVIEDAPLLERLIPRLPNSGLVIRVSRAPKLRTLGYLNDDINTFELGTMLFEKMVPVGLPNVMRSVKVLALLTPPCLDLVIGFLKCFPCVEKLYIVSYTKMIIQNDQGYAPLECLDRHLKKMQIINYEEDKSADVNFIKFFVLNARVLESLKIVVRQGQCDAKWIASQHKKLQVDARASLGARLDFEAENTCRFPRSVHMKHIHDLSMDPFDGS